MRGLLNYTTEVPAAKSAGQIVQALLDAGASAVKMESEKGDGRITGISWQSRTKHGVLPFRLPVKVEAVYTVLQKYRVQGRIRIGVDRARAERVAWRIAKDWVEAQMALLVSEMVTLEEVFLPYLLVGPQTSMYEALESRGFAAAAALGPGVKEGE